MIREAFARVETWIFDLDNTLYPAECHLFAQIDQRMTRFIEERLNLAPDAARRVQKEYYVRYGTTLSGLMTEHAVRPEDFMDYVHDIDLAAVDVNHALGEAIDALPGRRFIFTNGSRTHAENVAGKLGILDRFDDIVDIAGCDYTPKPHAAAFDRFRGLTGTDFATAAMFEDLPQNLEVPHAAGMETVLVQSDAAWFDDEPADKRPAKRGEKPPHVKHVTDDLTGFLRLITTRAPTA